MYSDELLAIQRDRAGQALFLMRDLLPLMAPVARHHGWTREEQWILGMLLTSSARSTESSLLLAAYGQLWDAEVILRSVAEGSLKFAYILQAPGDFKQRFQEYSVDHFNISLLKDDFKIREVLSTLGDPDSRGWKPFRDRLLPEDQLDALRKAYDTGARRSIESRWGVAGMLDTFRRSGDIISSRFRGTLHNYSLASHIQHADYIGISVPDERERREPARRDALHLAHLSRVISDAFSYLIMRLTSGYRFIGEDLGPIRSAASRVGALHDGFGEVYEDWMDIEYGPMKDDP
ncbi:MAG: hypothetical protein HZT39_02925 [Pseudoxanthomonas sp.]|nr:MAG: hypothetical protein HZT39_02925 [Pseudoxanthomonas sp.]